MKRHRAANKDIAKRVKVKKSLVVSNTKIIEIDSGEAKTLRN
jgi:hypothetical protein